MLESWHWWEGGGGSVQGVKRDSWEGLMYIKISSWVCEEFKTKKVESCELGKKIKKRKKRVGFETVWAIYYIERISCHTFKSSNVRCGPK